MPEQLFHVGNVVRFDFGPKKMIGVIKEDGGAIGKGGRRLYLVQFGPPTSQSLIELPADELEIVQREVSMQ